MDVPDVRGDGPARASVEPLEGRRLLSAAFYVSPRGSDANAGTDPQHAWRHIQQAMNAATPGSTVLVMPGTYREKVTVNVSGNATDGFITFQAQGRATISGLGIRTPDLINLNNQNYIQIIGFNLVNDLRVADGSGIRMNGHDDHINILNNTIHAITGFNAMGITAYGTDPVQAISNLVIDGNQIFNCQPANSEALTLNGNVHDFQVSNNYVHDVNNIGLDFIGGEGMSPDPSTDVARNGSVFNNRVTRAHRRGLADAAGIVVDGGRNITVERNTSWANDVGIEVNAVAAGSIATGVVVRDNSVYLNWGVGISIGASQQSDGTVTDCQVSNNTLYHDNARHTADGELRLQWGSGNTIENNLVSSARGTLLLDGQFGSFNNTSDYNLFYSPDGAAASRFQWDGVDYRDLGILQTTVQQDANSRFANPLLIGPGTLRPRVSPRSPALNAGNPAFTPAAGETDYYGNARVLGPQIDIGAIEVG
jgi:parallel beta-helix repeat protein